MRTPWDIPVESRSVWTGIAAIALGLSKLFFPELEIDANPTYLILFGVGLVYVRAAK